MPRLKRSAKRRIEQAIPDWLARWAAQGLKTGDWDALDRDPDANPFVLLEFIGVEDEVAEGITALIDNGDISVRDDAEFDSGDALRLTERIALEF